MYLKKKKTFLCAVKESGEVKEKKKERKKKAEQVK